MFPLVACNSVACLQVHIDFIFTDIRDFNRKLPQKAHQRLEGHFGSETVSGINRAFVEIGSSRFSLTRKANAILYTYAFDSSHDYAFIQPKPSFSDSGRYPPRTTSRLMDRNSYFVGLLLPIKCYTLNLVEGSIIRVVD